MRTNRREEKKRERQKLLPERGFFANFSQLLNYIPGKGKNRENVTRTLIRKMCVYLTARRDLESCHVFALKNEISQFCLIFVRSSDNFFISIFTRRDNENRRAFSQSGRISFLWLYFSTQWQNRIQGEIDISIFVLIDSNSIRELRIIKY